MGQIADSFVQAFRDYVVNGVPASGRNEPNKSEIRAIGPAIEFQLGAITAGVSRYPNVAAMNAAIGVEAGHLAYVYRNNGSASDSANGYYQYTGSAWEIAPWVGNGVGADIASLNEILENAGIPTAKQELNWNDITATGFYRGSSVTGQTTGAPTTAAYLTLLHIQGQGTAAFQLASQTSTSDSAGRWVRSRSAVSGEWGEWASIAATSAIKRAGVASGLSYLDNGMYRKVPQDSIYHTMSSGDVYANSAAALYARYDQFITDFPDYVTKRSLGQDDFGNDILEYTFAAPTIRGYGYTPEQKANPKIVMTGGVHPDEKNTIVGTLAFFDDLCRNHQQSSILSQLRRSCTIVFLPICNPSGVNSNTRVNGNGVNVGRNLSWDWANNNAPDRGPSPLSEKESVIIASLPALHPDACIFVDNHGHAGSHFTWIGARLTQSLDMALHTSRLLENKLRRQFVPAVYDNETVTAVTTTAIGGPPSEWAMVHNKNAILIENAENRAWAGISLADLRRVTAAGIGECLFEAWRRKSSEGSAGPYTLVDAVDAQASLIDDLLMRVEALEAD